MNKIKVVLGIFTLAVTLPAHSQIFLANGLVAYYPFAGGNLNDATGNGHNLLNYGATPCPDRFGREDQAFSFNGNASIASSAAPLTEIDDWTLTAWIQPTAFGSQEHYAVCMGYDNGDTGNGYAFGLSSGNDVSGFFGGVGGFTTGYLLQATNKWYQIVMVRNSGSTLIYVNGQTTSNTSSETPGAPTTFTIGSANGLRYFNGAINDVRVYNRALAPSEISELYLYESEPNVSYQATAVAEVTSGFVTGIAITYGGFGYTNTPTVTLSGGGGKGAQTAAVVSNGVVTAINVLNAGSNYTGVPSVVITPPTYPYPATAIAVVTNGFLTGASVVYAGNFYTNPPAVRIIGGGGSGAEAVAVVADGVVTAIDILDAGSDYTNQPLIVIDPPFTPNPILAVARTSLLTFSNLTVGDEYQLQEMTEGYYWTNQPVSFTATTSVYARAIPSPMDNGPYRLALEPVQAQAFAVPDVVYGFVVNAAVTNGGSGYTTNPAVNIVGGGGSGATATSQIFDGAVTNIIITDAGFGYTNTPVIEIAPPPAVAISPTVQSVVRLDSSNLAPYDNYQIQYKPALGAPWADWSGGLFIPSDATNSQYLSVTNAVAFFRIQHLP
ncbi:MAG TPA: LamG domain-containing protein [Verrucomicrobiae bacterium]|jgi:hypothetical protein|nr:LamG domain-containing protein [Verrucomicrobiae bacterium]